MKKQWLLAFGLATVLPSVQAVESITVANWFEYIDPQILSDFTRETGIEVQYQIYSDDQEAYDMIKAGTPLDVVMPSTALFGQMLQEGMLVPLAPRDSVVADQDAHAMLRLKMYDRDTRYAIPYLWGNVGIAVNLQQAEAALGEPVPHSWSLLFDPATLEKLKSCGVGLLNVSGTVVAALSYYQGVDLPRASSNDVEKSLDYLATLWPEYRYVESGQYPDDMRAGKLCVSMAWEGDAYAISKDNPGVQFILPEEGNEITMDVMAIPHTARNLEGAKAFIHYLARPNVMAQNVIYTHFHSTSTQAHDKLEAEGHHEPHTPRQLSDRALRPEIKELIEQRWDQLHQM